MDRKAWYLVAYDIADPKRLGRVYRIMKKEGLTVQKSVFFVHGSQSYVNVLLDRLAARINNKEDDIRAYPIRNAETIWTVGVNPMAGWPLMRLGRPSEKKSFWRRMWKAFR